MNDIKKDSVNGYTVGSAYLERTKGDLDAPRLEFCLDDIDRHRGDHGIRMQFRRFPVEGEPEFMDPSYVPEIRYMSPEEAGEMFGRAGYDKGDFVKAPNDPIESLTHTLLCHKGIHCFKGGWGPNLHDETLQIRTCAVCSETEVRSDAVDPWVTTKGGYCGLLSLKPSV